MQTSLPSLPQTLWYLRCLTKERPRWYVGFTFLLTAILPGAVYGQGPTPGQNVNMVSGTKWPGGDPFLRQQNEPSIAVSTRNPQHLLAGANDYRTVDLNLIDQLPINQLAGDAWLGVFKSFDGGQRWQSTLLPGFPQDQSSFGASSPMKGFAAASDPTVRAGTNGMFYYSGIALNRNTNIGGLFLARFIDLNNKENGDAAQSNYPAPTTDPIRYINTVEIDAGNAGQFIDKPWIAVDIPRTGAVTCTIQTTEQTGVDSNGNPITSNVTQTFPGGNVYIAYAVFVGGTIHIRSKIKFSKSSDCGYTWTKPIMISQTYDINQGAQVAVDPQTGYIYVAWRVFSGSGTDLDAIVITKSTDGGNTFSKAVPIRTLSPFTGSAGPGMFDQNTTTTEFRDQTMPTLAVDDSGIAAVPGRVYVAWAERGVPPSGDARILISTSTDGVTWSAPPTAVDPGPLLDDKGINPLNPQGNGRGHQLMPAMTFIGGKLMIVYYDLRLDATAGRFTANTPFSPDSIGAFFEEDRPYVGDPVASVFTPFIDDNGLQVRRHTMDVIVAQSAGGTLPAFTTARLSRYDFGLPGLNDVSLRLEQLEQLKVNPPNLPMFAGGTVPFLGDYVDVAGQMFVTCTAGSPGPVCPMGWRFNNPAPSSGAASALSNPLTNSPIYFGTWTTNQDVIPPADGVSWTKYTAPSQGTSVFNGQPLPACSTGYEGDRNQNIYESRITQGLYVSSPQNSKPLSQVLQRAFVVLLQNSTAKQRGFQLSIAGPQPPGTLTVSTGTPGQTTVGGYASFQQAVPNQPLPNPLPAPVTIAFATIPAHSGAARTVFALSSNFAASITVNVNEIQIDANGNPVLDANGNAVPAPGGLSSFIVLNADGSVPTLIDPDGAPANPGIAGVEVYTPGITHPSITVPGITHPGIETPGITHPNPTAPGITHPDYVTPGITHPGVPNQTPAAADIANTSLADASISASSGSNMLTDATFTFTNSGNTSAAYIVKLVGANNGSVPLQLAVTQVYTTQTAINCTLTPVTQDITNVNVTTPGITHPDFTNPGITHPAPTDATVLLAPGDSALITLRGETDATTMANLVNQVTPVVVPQAVNTNSGSSVPTIAGLFITTSLLPNANVGAPYTTTLQVVGGTAPYAWSAVSGGLSSTALSPSGVISFTPAIVGPINFTLQVIDSSTPQQVATRSFTIFVSSGLTITTAALPVALAGSPYSSTLQATGGVGNVIWAINSGDVLPAGLTLNTATGVISGITSSGAVGTTFAVQATDSSGGVAARQLSIGVVNSSNVKTVVNTNDSGAGSLRQAMLDANATSQPVSIVFNIGNGGAQTIAPVTALPTLTTPTFVDGTTQPGYAGTPIIELNGSNAGAAVNGIHIAAGSSTVRGLAINRFTGNGILLDSNGGDVIQGNYIGTDVTGAVAEANSGNGIQILATPSNVIGGTAFSARNVISGNNGEGLRIDGTLATGNIVLINYIGTNAAGLAAVANNNSGIYIRRAPGNMVSGSLVSGNAGFGGITICGNATFCGGGDPAGIDVTSSAAGNVIQGNFVGTDATGATPLPNTQAGVSIDGAPSTVVGGSGGPGNFISFNGTNDVQLFSAGANSNKIQLNQIRGSTTATTVGISVGIFGSSPGITGNTLSQNSISGHSGLGIDLAPPGINPNTAGGAHNFPVITSALPNTSSNTLISGTLSSTANATFTIEFFSSQSCNPSGNGEGAFFRGAITTTTNGDGNATFNFVTVGPSAGDVITATATDASGTTSEFSACTTVTVP